MALSQLPGKRLISKAFAERGRDDVVKIDVVHVNDGEHVKVIFESTSSPWRQGVWLRTDAGVVVGAETLPSVRLWSDATNEISIQCRSENHQLHLYNIWDRGKGPESQSWTSGMLVEEISNGFRYRCNDIGFDTDFSKVVFCIHHIG